MPYFAATYASNVNKIFATLGPYIVQCNATTGVRESATKLAATAIYGDMPIVYHAGAGMLFVGSGNTPVKQSDNSWTNDPPVFKDLYQVNPTSMAVTATNVINSINNGFGPEDGLRGGPYFVMADGNYVYFLYSSSIGSTSWGRIHAGTFAYNGGGGSRFRAEQLTVGSTYAATDYVFRLDPNQRQVEYYNQTGIEPNGGFVSAVDIAPYLPVGICLASDGFNYVVCGDDNLVKQNSLTDFDTTVFILSTIIGPTSPPDPCRIRSIGGYLYMPCMTANGIIKWNPSTGNLATATWFGGFEGPIDVISTGSKLFAVQNSPIGLKEII